jgi:hypothetical protein
MNITIKHMHLYSVLKFDIRNSNEYIHIYLCCIWKSLAASNHDCCVMAAHKIWWDGPGLVEVRGGEIYYIHLFSQDAGVAMETRRNPWVLGVSSGSDVPAYPLRLMPTSPLSFHPASWLPHLFKQIHVTLNTRGAQVSSWHFTATCDVNSMVLYQRLLLNLEPKPLVLNL